MAIATADIAITSADWTNLGASPCLVQLKTEGEVALLHLLPAGSSAPSNTVTTGLALPYRRGADAPPDYNITITAQVFARLAPDAIGTRSAVLARVVTE